LSHRYKHALIIGSGEDVPSEHPPITRETVVICADGGGKHAQKWGLTPAILLGDMDSISPQVYEYWKEKGVRFLEYPVHKDKTDVELGVDYAVELGVSSFSLVGVWGDRIDHSLGNLELLYSLAERGMSNVMYTASAALAAFQGGFSTEIDVDTTVSLIPLTQKVEGVTTSGLQYPLHQATLEKGSTLGISNKSIETGIDIQCSGGILLIIMSK